MSWYHFLYMNLGKVRKTFGGQVWVKYEPLVNWVSSDVHVGQEAMSCNVCPVAIPEICAQTQGSDYWQLIHWCQSTCGPSVALHIGWYSVVMLNFSVSRYPFNRCLKYTISAPFNHISRTKIWSLTEPEDGLVPDRLPFIEPNIDTTWAGQKNCPGFQLMSQKMLRFFQGHERPDKANKSRARAGQEPDNAEYLYTF